MEAYEIATGKVAWGVDGLPAEMKSVPVVAGDLVLVHGYNSPENDAGKLISIPPFSEALKGFDKDGDRKLSKEESPSRHATSLWIYLDLDGDGKLDEGEWDQYIRSMRAENALLAYKIGGGLVWKFLRSIPQLPSPLVYRGVLYMINEGGVLTTLDPATGKLHKQARLRGEADKYYSSPVAADGKVYITSHTGKVSVLKAGAEQELLAVNDVEDEVLATPALVDGRVLIRTKEAVICYGNK
jgi:outer membrane protein assembly factor BamB